jgi:hypothetical protein
MPGAIPEATVAEEDIADELWNDVKARQQIRVCAHLLILKRDI